MLGKANSDVTPTFAVSFQKPQGSITVAFCSSYLTLHTQGIGKERLVRFHATRSMYASWVKHFKKSCYPNNKLIDQLKTCHQELLYDHWYWLEPRCETEWEARILVCGTDPLPHPRHYLVWVRAKEASWGRTLSSRDHCIYLVHYPALL